MWWCSKHAYYICRHLDAKPEDFWRRNEHTKAILFPFGQIYVTHRYAKGKLFKAQKTENNVDLIVADEEHSHISQWVW